MISQKEIHHYCEGICWFWVIIAIFSALLIGRVLLDNVIVILIIGLCGIAFSVTFTITEEHKLLQELKLYKESLLEIRYFKGKNKVRILCKQHKYWKARTLEVPLTYHSGECVFTLKQAGMSFTSESFNFWKQRKVTKCWLKELT